MARGLIFIPVSIPVQKKQRPPQGFLDYLRQVENSCTETRRELNHLRTKDRVKPKPEVKNTTDSWDFERLHDVFKSAVKRAQHEKGKERHAPQGEPLSQQPISSITRGAGYGFAWGQAVKKIYEGKLLMETHTSNPIEAHNNFIRAKHELEDALVYLATSIAIMDDEEGKSWLDSKRVDNANN